MGTREDCSCFPRFVSPNLIDLNMRYVAAALLLQLSEQEVTAEAIGKILGSVGVETDKKNLDIVLKNIKGKNIDELMAAGVEKLASVGGGAPAAPEAAPAAAAKKEEPEEEEEDDDMGFGLFD